MNSTFSIIEYQAFSKEDLKEIFKEKAEGFYKELEDFAKNNENLLGFKNKNSLKAKNYVGIIQTKSGVLEILPKCTNLDSYKKEDSSSNHDKEKLRRCYESVSYKNLTLPTNKEEEKQIVCVGLSN
ncbi:hypothetical protein ACISOT_04805, partial [Campylobacter jejuni]